MLHCILIVYAVLPNIFYVIYAVLPGIWLIIFIVLPCILYIKYAVLSCILYGGSKKKKANKQANKQQTNNTGTEAGPRWLAVLLSCGGGNGGGDGSVLRQNVASFITFYNLHFVVIKHPEILTICIYLKA